MKRKVLSFFLMIMVLFSVVAPGIFNSSFAADDVALEISTVETLNIESGKDAEIMLNISNSSNKDISAYLINGLYEEDTNKLVSYYYIKSTIPANGDVEWGSCIPIPENGNYKIKAFAWDKLSDTNVISNILDVGSREKIGTARLFIDDITERPSDEVSSSVPTGTILPITEANVYEGDTAATFVKRILDAKGMSSKGLDSETPLLTDVNGLAMSDGGDESWWAFLVNGYPPQLNTGYGAGLGDYIVEDNDFIHITYSCQGWGADVGSGSSVSTENIISDVIIDAKGESLYLDQGDFDSSSTDYTLGIDSDVESVKIRLEQDIEKLRGITQIKVGDTEYKFWQDISVENGTVIKLVDSANTYNITVKTRTGTAYLFTDDVTERPNANVSSPTPKGVILSITKGNIYEGDTAASFSKRVFDANGIENEGLEDNPAYLSKVDGLSEFEGGGQSGWLYMVNGYPPQLGPITGAGMSQYTMEDNDFVHITYTCQGYGADVGFPDKFGKSTENIISDIIVSVDGKITTVDGGFDSDVTNHSLTIDEDVDVIKLRLQQDIEKRIGVTQIKVGEIEYKFWQDIPVEDGTIIKLIDSANTHNLSIINGGAKMSSLIFKGIPVTTSGAASVILK